MFSMIMGADRNRIHKVLTNGSEYLLTSEFIRYISMITKRPLTLPKRFCEKSLEHKRWLKEGFSAEIPSMADEMSSILNSQML